MGRVDTLQLFSFCRGNEKLYAHNGEEVIESHLMDDLFYIDAVRSIALNY